MFIDLDLKPLKSTAMIDDNGRQASYEDILNFKQELTDLVKPRSIILMLTENTVGACLAYAAAVAAKFVPLILNHSMPKDMIDNLINSYNPGYIWLPDALIGSFPYTAVFNKYGYTLLKTELTPYPLYDDLSMLLPTSGSTGSPKLVRHSYTNIEANAKAVSKVFGFNSNSRGLMSLPLSFTQGLNVATSHLYVGGTVLLTGAALTSKEFWNFLKAEKAESITGVPYSFEVLKRIRFFQMDLPHLKIINQGGGRLTKELFEDCAKYALEKDCKFIPTYGATETTSRMAYLPPDMALSKNGSIGRPLPGCSLTLIDDNGNEISEPNQTGEIVFNGPNVTLGYAEQGRDLILGDTRNGSYKTGDIAYKDEDGCFFITGRKSRFLKLYGFRVSLDETERMIKSNLEIDCACIGTDKQMYVFTTQADDSIINLLSQNIGIPKDAFSVRKIEIIPKNSNNKTHYSELESIIKSEEHQ